MNDPEQTKICRECKQPRLISEFWRRKENADGRETVCKWCKGYQGTGSPWKGDSRMITPPRITAGDYFDTRRNKRGR